MVKVKEEQNKRLENSKKERTDLEDKGRKNEIQIQVQGHSIAQGFRQEKSSNSVSESDYNSRIKVSN